MKTDFSLLRNTIVCFLGLFFSLSYGQKEYSGIVYDDATKKPLESVVVYLNGTTKGTVTNAKGSFYLELDKASNESLIISYLGYQNIILDPSEIEDTKHIVLYLKEELEPLDPVFLENDDWSRKKKMHYFKLHFIGSEKVQKTCTILNEDDVNLFYSSSDKTLYASAYKPIKIKNDFFGYTISYDLTDFEAKFKFSDKGRPLIKEVFFMGTSFFKEFDDTIETEDKKEYINRRKKAFKGSVLHFMRSLADNALVQNNFQLLYEGKKTLPDKHFKVSIEDGFANVEADVEKIAIKHNTSYRSYMIFNSKNTNFTIDGFGNYRPVRLFSFSGYMGRLKVGKMLPLDYEL